MLKLSWLLPLAILFQEMSALKKEIWGNKKGQVPRTSKKRKSETRGKNGKVSDSRIWVTRYPPERKEKENTEPLILSKKFQKSKKCMYPPKEQSRIKLSHCYHHHYHTPFIRNTCTSWFDLLTCFSGFMVWLYNKCLVSMYTLSPTYELQILKPY